MRWGTMAVAIGCVVVSCGGPPRVTEAPSGRATTSASASTSAPLTGSVAPISLGKTRLIPLVSDSFQTRDELTLDKESTLYVGSSGQRWLVRDAADPLPDDPEHTRYVLNAAPMMAPETLVAARRRSDGSFVFIGESGAVYTAKEALGDLLGVRTPPQPLRGVSVGKEAILGITRDDTLLRSVDGGASFSPVALPSTAAIPIQLAGSPLGELAIVAAPARTFASLDDGATFRRVDVGGLAPVSATRSGITNLLYFKGYTVSATKPPGLAAMVSQSGVLSRVGDAPALERTNKSPTGISRPINDDERLDLADALVSSRAVMHELRYLEVRSEDGLLHAFVLDGNKVQRAPIPGSNDCELGSVVNAGATVIVACARTLSSPKGDREELRFYRSADFGKTFALEGALPSTPDSDKTLAVSSKGTIFATGGCVGSPCAPLVTKPLGGKFAAAKTPAGLRVQRLVTSGDGDRVYAVATVDEDGTSALLVSRDAGKTFAARPMQLDHTDVLLAYDDASSTLALFATGDPVERHATRDDGATWDVRQLPFAADWLSLAGARGLATGGGKGYETLDFGATWGPVPLPASSAVGGTMPIACTPRGCMLGDVALREGWELASAADLKPIGAKTATKQPAHLPLVECAADGDEIELGGLLEPEIEPTPALAFVAAAETAGAVDLVMWPRGGKALSRVPLLPTPKEASGVRRWVHGDGVIAMRIARGDGKSVADVEVAWWVASSNKVFRGALPKAASSLGKWGTPSGMAAIVPGHGLYVRPGNSAEPTLYLVKESGSAAKVPISSAFPAYPRLFARRTAKGTVFAGPIHESLVGDRVVMFTTLADTGALTTHAWSLWPRTSTRAELSFAGDQLVLATAGDATMTPHTWALSWKDAAVEPPEPSALPAGRAVVDAPSCASSGTRVEVPWSPGLRAPFVVRVGKRVLHLATVATTLRVGDKTCARGVLAGHPNAAPSNEWLIVPSDDPAHAFVLARGPKAHALTRVTCAKSSAPLPPAFLNAKGF